MNYVITGHSFLAFAAFMGIGLLILLLAITLVALITPHKEITLIRQGNKAAGIGMAGALVGLALPINSVISHSVSLVDAAIWAAIAAVMQMLAFGISRAIITRRGPDQIDAGNESAGWFSAGVAIAVGLVNSAAMVP
jgi:putative membrane protein